MPSNTRWTELLEEADSLDGAMEAKALVSQVTGDGSYCDAALVTALEPAGQPDNFEWPVKAGNIALVYAWSKAATARQRRDSD